MRGSPRWSRRGSGSTPTGVALLIRAMPELKARAHDLNQLAEGAAFLFASRPLAIDDKAAALLTDEARGHLAAAHRALAAVPAWDHDSTDAAVREVAERLELKLGKLAQPLRAALTGKTTSPGIFDVLALLGQRREPGAHRRSNAGAERMTDQHRQPRPPRAAISPIRCSKDRSAPTSSTSASSMPRPASSPTIPASPRPRRARARSPTSTATRASCSTAAIRSTSSPSSRRSWKSPICCSTATCRARPELDDFNYTITRHTMVHEQLATFFRGFRRDAHPMAIMCGVVGALSAFYHDSTDITDPQQRLIASHRLIAKMPTIAAMAYQIFDRPAVHLSPRTT